MMEIIKLQSSNSKNLPHEQNPQPCRFSNFWFPSPSSITACDRLLSLVAVKTRVNWNKLNVHTENMAYVRAVSPRTSGSSNTTKSSMTSEADPIYTNKSCESWSRVNVPLGSIHLPMIRRNNMDCSSTSLQVSGSSLTGMVTFEKIPRKLAFSRSCHIIIRIMKNS